MYIFSTKSQVLSVKDLQRLSLKDKQTSKLSFFDYACEVQKVLEDMELTIVQSDWTIGDHESLYGCIEVNNSCPNKEVQELNDIGFPEGKLFICTRFSPSSQAYGPSFFGALLVGFLEEKSPYVITTGLAGKRSHQSKLKPIQDIVEEGVCRAYSKSYELKELSEKLEFSKAMSYEAFGIVCKVFLSLNLPITKMKKALDLLDNISAKDNERVKGLDILRAIYSVKNSLTIPHQYKVLANSTPVVYCAIKQLLRLND